MKYSIKFVSGRWFLDGKILPSVTGIIAIEHMPNSLVWFIYENENGLSVVKTFNSEDVFYDYLNGLVK